MNGLAMNADQFKKILFHNMGIHHNIFHFAVVSFYTVSTRDEINEPPNNNLFLLIIVNKNRTDHIVNH